jgi:hypothetical protein
MAQEIISGPINCACVIHGTAYDWTYVTRLHSMLSRHLTPGVRLHVYTEPDREVPAHMVKHELANWNIGGPKQSWWYKMQLFNSEHYQGPLLYFDLDVVIVQNLDWIWQLPLDRFYAARDFKYLWRPTNYDINSSIMWWDTTKFEHIWQSFKSQPLRSIMSRYRGDQDYISAVIPQTERQFFPINRIQSYRWQCLDGGYDFSRKRHLMPGTGTCLTDLTSVLVFHGQPKPAQIRDHVIEQNWR